MTQPAYAADNSYVVGQYIKSELTDKPVKSWDEAIAPQIAQVEHTKAEAQRLAAEAEAKRAAEEAAAQAAALAASYSQPKPSQVAVAISGDCAAWMAAAGVDDYPNAIYVINSESGCNPNAVNASSGACGVGQALPCSKMGCAMGDGYCQMRWMQSYVMGRYGSWSAAAAFWRSHSWY